MSSTVTARFFSIARDIAGADTIEIDVDGPITISELLSREPLKSVIEGLRNRGVEPIVLVNGERVEANSIVRPGDEVAVLPPSSGG